MEFAIMGGRFNLEEHRLSIRDFEQARDNREREQLFIPIAETILASEHFRKVHRPEKSQSVPFDFIAIKAKKLALIEMKGAGDGFNCSSVVQFARLFDVLEKIGKKGLQPSLFLIQINLKLGIYQILTQQFYELAFTCVKEMREKQSIGRKQTITPSLDAIEDYRRKHGL